MLVLSSFYMWGNHINNVEKEMIYSVDRILGGKWIERFNTNKLPPIWRSRVYFQVPLSMLDCLRLLLISTKSPMQKPSSPLFAWRGPRLPHWLPTCTVMVDLESLPGHPLFFSTSKCTGQKYTQEVMNWLVNVSCQTAKDHFNNIRTPDPVAYLKQMSKSMLIC